jgi:ubiquinone biosynthesis protein COQ9
LSEPTPDTFDAALIESALRLIAAQGWNRLSIAEAAQEAGLSLATARTRFPNRFALLKRFGQLIDESALRDAPVEGPVRDRLFDLLMRRFDAIQAHRSGVLGLMKALPYDPPAALCLACGTRSSMRWMLQAAGVATDGIRGGLRIRGLMGVWLWGMRAWQHDDSADLSTTMAAVDKGLDRADAAEKWFGRGARPSEAADQDPPDPDAPHCGAEHPDEAQT